MFTIGISYPSPLIHNQTLLSNRLTLFICVCLLIIDSNPVLKALDEKVLLFEYFCVTFQFCCQARIRTQNLKVTHNQRRINCWVTYWASCCYLNYIAPTRIDRRNSIEHQSRKTDEMKFSRSKTRKRRRRRGNSRENILDSFQSPILSKLGVSPNPAK